MTKKGFKLQGSGKADVQTAPWFKPNGKYQVKIKSDRGAEVVKTRADKEGRLRVELDFGSKHVGDEVSVSFKQMKHNKQ
ncbi:hypothetical protein [Fictibacillus nanhaiensis]|uniref:hypothetical protein n=1 Tax=Fictibacillus nanhaiensis TaxID=742169 RepID=UPI003C1474E7